MAVVRFFISVPGNGTRVLRLAQQTFSWQGYPPSPFMVLEIQSAPFQRCYLPTHDVRHTIPPSEEAQHTRAHLAALGDGCTDIRLPVCTYQAALPLPMPTGPALPPGYQKQGICSSPQGSLSFILSPFFPFSSQGLQSVSVDTKWESSETWGPHSLSRLLPSPSHGSFSLSPAPACHLLRTEEPTPAQERSADSPSPKQGRGHRYGVASMVWHHIHSSVPCFFLPLHRPYLWHLVMCRGGYAVVNEPLSLTLRCRCSIQIHTH